MIAWPRFTLPDRDVALALLMLASVLGSFAGAMFTPFFSAFVERVGGDVLAAGIAQAAFFVTAGLVALLSGRVADRFGKRRMVILGFLGLFIGDVMMLFVSSVATLVVAELVLGLSLALTNPAWSGLFAALLRPGEESTYYGKLEFSYNISFAIASMFGALLLATGGFWLLLAAKAALHAGSVVACLCLPVNGAA